MAQQKKNYERPEIKTLHDDYMNTLFIKNLNFRTRPDRIINIFYVVTYVYEHSIFFIGIADLTVYYPNCVWCRS